MNEVLYLHPSPLGTLALQIGDQGLQRLVIDVDPKTSDPRLASVPRLSDPAEHQLATALVTALDAYFQGELRTFKLPLELTGLSSFSVAVLHALQQVPYGVTCSYGELACSAGRPRAARAVGRVMAINPLPLIIPCHRVLPAGGGLGGYSGGQGPTTKRWLLDFEKRVTQATP